MGSVWRAEHLELKSPVALKLIDPAIAADERMLARFMREAQSAAALRSPHVVQIFDYGVDGDTAFIAMELLTGESLASAYRALERDAAGRGASLHPARCCARSHKAHEAGIVHRDLKPDNVFLVQGRAGVREGARLRRRQGRNGATSTSPRA